MDCGPACLKCLLEGHGIPVSYGRLREACQTDVDGTSIDTLEAVARELGLDAEETMVPIEHLLLDEARALPAMVVTRLANGFTHFVVAWRRHGPWLQLMDPAIGRRWVLARRFLEEVYIHEHRIDAASWREWASSEGFLDPLERRMHDLGLAGPGRTWLDVASASSGWRPLAALDAAIRLSGSLVAAGAIRRGREAEVLVTSLLERGPIPDAYWSARAPPAPEGPAAVGFLAEAGDGAGGEQVLLRGAVLLGVRGRLPVADGSRSSLGPELAAALSEPPPRPGREILGLLRGDGALSLGTLAGALFLATGAAVLEALLLRGAMEVGRDLGLVTQRLGAAGCFLVFAAGLL